MITPKPIEDAPWGVDILAEYRDGSWMRCRRFDSPFGQVDAVVNERTGAWWRTSYWIYPNEMEKAKARAHYEALAEEAEKGNG